MRDNNLISSRDSFSPGGNFFQSPDKIKQSNFGNTVNSFFNTDFIPQQPSISRGFSISNNKFSGIKRHDNYIQNSPSLTNQHKSNYYNDQSSYLLDQFIHSNNRISHNDDNNSYHLLNNLSTSYLKKIIDDRRYKKKLEIIRPHNISSQRQEFEQSLYELGIKSNFPMYIQNIKTHYLEKMIPKYLDYHISNINSLNKILKDYHIVVENEIQEDFNMKLLLSQFYQSRGNQTLSIFWGDIEKFHCILNILNDKINKLSLSDKENIKSIDDKFNALLKSQIYSSQMKNHETRETLIRLQADVIKRLEFNEILPIRSKYRSKNELFLKMEYIIWRLENLQSNRLKDFSCCQGGNYRNLPWVSFFPTDSSLFAEIFVNNIEGAIIEHNTIKKNFMVCAPLKPQLDDDAGLKLYGSNLPEYESTYHVVYNKRIYNCLPVSKVNFRVRKMYLRLL